MVLIAILVLITLSHSLNAMVVTLKRDPEKLLAEITANGDEKEKKWARLYFDGQISGVNFFEEIEQLNQVKVRKNLQKAQLARQQRTIDAVNGLLNSVEYGPEQVEIALQQIDEAGSQYSLRERHFGASIFSDPEKPDGLPVNDSGLYYLNNSEFMAKALLKNIVRGCRGPTCAAVIQAVQTQYDVRKKAQEMLFYRSRKLVSNLDVFKTFLDLGVKPYWGWNFAGDYTTGGFSSSVSHNFADSKFCWLLLTNRSAAALEAVLEHFPSFATKKLLHKMVRADARDAEDTLLKQMFPVYQKMDLHYPEFPHECILEDEIALDCLSSFLEWGSHFFDFNYRYKRIWQPAQTVLDCLAFKTFSAMNDEDMRKKIAATQQLVSMQYDSADPGALVQAAEKKERILNADKNTYNQFPDLDSEVGRQKDTAWRAMVSLITTLKQRFGLVSPPSILIDVSETEMHEFSTRDALG